MNQIAERVPVVSIARECQYCWDSEYGRVRCGRLAYSYLRLRYGKSNQLSFRCESHRGKLNDTTLMSIANSSLINPGATFGLGYKP
jgi:hypothetical protein